MGQGELEVVGAIVTSTGAEGDGRVEDGFLLGAERPGRGRVLVARLAPHKRLAGLWEFPGGKVEPGETPEVALARELEEELGLSVEVGALVGVGVAGRVRLSGYRCRWVGGRIGAVKKDHDAFAWAEPSALGTRYAMPDADLPIAARLRGEG